LTKTGANELIPDSANFLRDTFRELGSIRGERQDFFDTVQHEAPEGLSAIENLVKMKYWENEGAQTLLRSIARLQRGHQLFYRDDVREDLMEVENHKLSKPAVTKLLNEFRKDVLIEKDPSEKDWYRVTKVNRKRLVLFMNEEYGEIPDDDLEYYSSEDDTTIEPNSESSESEPGFLSPDIVTSEYQTPPNNRRGKSPNHINVVTPPSVLHSGSADFPIVLNDDDSDISISDIGAQPKQKKRKAASSPQLQSRAKKRKVTPSPQPITQSETQKPRAITQTRKRSKAPGKSPRPSSKGQFESGVVQRVAKFDDDNTSEIHFGDVVGQYDGEDELWWIQFDDGVDEDFDFGQLQKGLQLYSIHQSKDCSIKCSERRTLRLGRGSIPMVSKEDEFITGRCIIQSHYKRRIYYTANGDTPDSIAELYRVDADDIIDMNKKRAEFKRIDIYSELNKNSALLLPL
jgi:hypothetical protein